MLQLLDFLPALDLSALVAPVLATGNRGIPPQDVREAERLVFENQQLLIESFHEYHNR
jgi:hypothetical protein